jgi:hypothetical protein
MSEVAYGPRVGEVAMTEDAEARLGPLGALDDAQKRIDSLERDLDVAKSDLAAALAATIQAERTAHAATRAERDAFDSALDAKHARLVEVADELRAESVRADALVASLPKCDKCSNPATQAFRRGEGRWCDDHQTTTSVDYPRAEPIRAIQRARAEER